ncbi:MAG: short-chain dehydrogenase [Pseudonocardiales bacterium]|jgi:NAD(P)-dependent dehydrogenase (short-subunit alcohol dehydrogenase family)|nr:short-chain dehydrogenase [Pseudonocardiales bacterium]
MAIGTNTRVVVLGGTSGIGLATAKAAAAAGASVVVASHNATRVRSAVAQLPTGSEGYPVDASSSEELAALFEQVGEFDHLAYTAGDNLVPLTLDAYTPAQGRAFLELRVVSALEAVRLAMPHLRPGGSVTLTSGTAAYRGGAGWFLGSAASGAIVSAARSLAVELAPIRVNVVAPGVVRSPLWTALPGADREAMFESVGAGLPLRRVAEVEDVAKAFLHLMDNDYLTGTVSVVDGGTLAA